LLHRWDRDLTCAKPPFAMAKLVLRHHVAYLVHAADLLLMELVSAEVIGRRWVTIESLRRGFFLLIRCWCFGVDEAAR
jgi:hypothetical protein